MVSTREVIGWAVSVLDAVDQVDVSRAVARPGVFDAFGSFSWMPAGAGHADGADAGLREGPARDLSPEALALVAALERHLQRMLSPRAPERAEAASAQSMGPCQLTDRETEALVLLSRGLTAAATARRMGCSTSTANKHLGNVYRKLGVSDRLEAVLEAQRRGLLPLGHHRDASPAEPVSEGLGTHRIGLGVRGEG